MAYYKNICFVEAPQAIVTPFPRFISDCIGVCYLAGAVAGIAESMAMPDNYYNERIFESFERLLKSRPFDLAAISSMTGGFNNAVRLARIAKKHGVTVVMGGFHPTAMPEEALDQGCADLVVIGEGAATFRELVEHGPSRGVKGLVWKENSDFVYTGMRELIMDVDSIRLLLRSTRPPRFGEEIALIHDPKKKKLLKIRDANFLTNIKRARRFADFSAGSRSVCFSGAGEPEHGKGGDRIGDLWRI
jgi:anaerobic magnesium-protoporphyrin IX monomethyl ester cyclase